MVFNNYAKYYDLFYRDKDYSAEANYVLELSALHGMRPKRLLDIGCGTGRHAIEWARLGIEVTGIDRSEQMLNQALRRIPEELEGRVKFSKGDFRNIEVQWGYFDVVTAMFAVLGYIADQEDLIKALRTIHKALRPEGFFICDTWHGAAVLSERPSSRMQIFERPEGKLYRFVQPHLDPISQIVNVHYVIIDTSDSIAIHEETHRMRFFFKEEIQLLARMTGFKLAYCCPFMRNGQSLCENDWHSSWVFQKKYSQTTYSEDR